MRLLLVIFAAICGFASCSQKIGSDIEKLGSGADPDASHSSFSVRRTKAEAERLALRFAASIRFGEMRGEASLLVSKVLPLETNTFRVASETESVANTSLFLVEFSNDQGYALVFGDKRNGQVCYLADSGTFDERFYAKNLRPHILSYISTAGYSRPNPIHWECPRQYPGCTDPKTCTHVGIGLETELANKTISLIGQKILLSKRIEVIREQSNLLTTNWHLWEPFNLRAPEKTISITNDDTGEISSKTDRVEIGCNTVTMLQIMAYYQYPNQVGIYTVPWERFRLMDDFRNPNDINLIADLSYYLATSINSTFGIANTFLTAAYSNDAIDFLVNLGYKQPEKTAYDIKAVKNELDNRRPVVITGGVKNSSVGHIWLIDGYKEVKFIAKYNDNSEHPILNPKTKKEAFDFVHCNWGWGYKANNGYCLSEIFFSKQQHSDLNSFNPDIHMEAHEYAYVEDLDIRVGLSPQDTTL